MDPSSFEAVRTICRRHDPIGDDWWNRQIGKCPDVGAEFKRLLVSDRIESTSLRSSMQRIASSCILAQCRSSREALAIGARAKRLVKVEARGRPEITWSAGGEPRSQVRDGIREWPTRSRDA
nr:hypothetical protein CFP56_53212 [Quercus suber]POF05826.1 hypothetical protein CFP56_53213 [Quercus suber]